MFSFWSERTLCPSAHFHLHKLLIPFTLLRNACEFVRCQMAQSVKLHNWRCNCLQTPSRTHLQIPHLHNTIHDTKHTAKPNSLISELITSKRCSFLWVKNIQQNQCSAFLKQMTLIDWLFFVNYKPTKSPKNDSQSITTSLFTKNIWCLV